MPGRGWYVLAVLIVLGSLAGAVALAVTRLGGIGAGLVQVVVPGGATLDLKAPGTYTIYHERTSQIDGRLYTSGDISGLRVTVRAADGGRSIAVRPPSGSSTYNLAGRSGTSVLAFTIEAPGSYRIEAGYDDGRREPRAVLAVGTGFVTGLLVTIGLSAAIALAGLAVALTIVIVVLLKRRQLLRQA
jgi:hypothetical protein